MQPEVLIRNELIAHLKLYKKLRELVEKKIEDPELDPEDLSRYMELLRRGIVEMSKPILPVARAAELKPIETDEDAASILQKLIGG